MPVHSPTPPGIVLRHFTVAVFVVHEERVLLHFHRKLGRWLPPGGHVEENELPDDAAVREVEEETGVRARLIGARGLDRNVPRQLVVPAGIQVEDIYPGHQHVDLVYFAVPDNSAVDAHLVHPHLAERDRVGWHSLDALEALGVDDEIRAWSARAVREAPARAAAEMESAPENCLATGRAGYTDERNSEHLSRNSSALPCQP